MQDDFLRTIWACRLPPHVQVILAGQTAVWITPRTLLTEFARSLSSQQQRVSPLRCPTTQPSYGFVSRNCHARWPHSGRHKPAAARTPETTAAAHFTPHRHAKSSAGTTGVSGTKRENMYHHAPASRRPRRLTSAPPAPATSLSRTAFLSSST